MTPFVTGLSYDPVTARRSLDLVAAEQEHGAFALVRPVLASPAQPRLPRHVLHRAPRILYVRTTPFVLRACRTRRKVDARQGSAARSTTADLRRQCRRSASSRLTHRRVGLHVDGRCFRVLGRRRFGTRLRHSTPSQNIALVLLLARLHIV